MIGTIIFRLYLIGVTAGLLFPLLDSTLLKYSEIYREIAGNTDHISIKIYRKGPTIYKFYAALIPVINMLHVFGIILILFGLLRCWIYRKKLDFIFYLASRSLKKRFIFRTYVVKIFFRKHLSYYYKCITMTHTPELTDAMIKLATELIKKGKKETATKDNSDEPEKAS